MSPKFVRHRHSDRRCHLPHCRLDATDRLQELRRCVVLFRIELCQVKLLHILVLLLCCISLTLISTNCFDELIFWQHIFYDDLSHTEKGLLLWRSDADPIDDMSHIVHVIG